MDKEINRGRKKKDIDCEFAGILSRLLLEAKENGISQDNIANSIGVSRQSIGKWANGATVPDILDLKKLANYFNVSTDYLLGLTENTTTNTEMQAVSKYIGLSDTAIKNILSAFSGNCIYCDGNDVQKIRQATNIVLSMPSFWKMISELIALEKSSSTIKRPLVSSDPFDEFEIKVILAELDLTYRQFIQLQDNLHKNNNEELNEANKMYQASKNTSKIIISSINEMTEVICSRFDRSRDYLELKKSKMLEYFNITETDLQEAKEELKNNVKHNPQEE